MESSDKSIDAPLSIGEAVTDDCKSMALEFEKFLERREGSLELDDITNDICCLSHTNISLRILQLLFV